MKGELMETIEFKILCLLLNRGCNTHQAISMLESIVKELKDDAGIE